MQVVPSLIADACELATLRMFAVPAFKLTQLSLTQLDLILHLTQLLLILHLTQLLLILHLTQLGLILHLIQPNLTQLNQNQLNQQNY